MGIEQALAELTAAVKENTAVHREFTEVAKQASGKKAAAKDVKPAEETVEQKPAASEPEEKPAAKKGADKPAAEKKAAPAKGADKKADKAPAAPVLAAEVSWDELKVLAKGFMAGDDEAARELAKKRMGAAFSHLGIKALPEIEDDDEARAKLAAYVAYWNAGQKVVFEQVDEALAEVIGAGGTDDDGEGAGEEDDGLGI